MFALEPFDVLPVGMVHGYVGFEVVGLLGFVRALLALEPRDLLIV